MVSNPLRSPRDLAERVKRLLCDAGFHSELRISGIIGNIRFFLPKKYVLSADIRASQPFAVTKTLIFDQKLVFSGKNLAGREVDHPNRMPFQGIQACTRSISKRFALQFLAKEHEAAPCVGGGCGCSDFLRNPFFSEGRKRIDADSAVCVD